MTVRPVFTALCSHLFLFVLASVSTLYAETRIGVIGLDTSHTIAFTEMLNVKRNMTEFADFRVTAAYQYGSLDIPSSTNRYPEYLAKMKGMGVTILPSVAELLKQTDCILLETNDGRRHYEQALEVFQSGKRVFIDKPIAASLSDTVKILEAAKKYHASFFSASSLRYVANVQLARAGKLGKVLGADVFSPFTVEPTHSEYYWYAVHGVEPLITIMGTGCKSVSCYPSEQADVLVGVWEDGRVGIARAIPKQWKYGGCIFTNKGATEMGNYEGYRPLLQEILTFFRTGVVPVDPQETLEIFAFMEAATESKRKGGIPVTLAEVLEKAREAKGK